MIDDTPLESSEDMAQPWTPPAAVPAQATAPNLLNDPNCKQCGGTGSYVARYSGSAEDGNAPEHEPCECWLASPSAEPARWCWFHDGDERVPVLYSEDEAHAEAQQWIDDNCEPGEQHEYLVAPMKSGLDLLPSAQHIGESVCESINENLSDEMGAEEDPIDFAAEDRIKLGELVRAFILQAGSEQWWTVDTKRQVKHCYTVATSEKAAAA